MIKKEFQTNGEEMDYSIYGTGRTTCYASFLYQNQLQIKQKFKCKNKTIKILRKIGINYSYQLRVGRSF